MPSITISVDRDEALTVLQALRFWVRAVGPEAASGIRCSGLANRLEVALASSAPVPSTLPDDGAAQYSGSIAVQGG